MCQDHRHAHPTVSGPMMSGPMVSGNDNPGPGTGTADLRREGEPIIVQVTLGTLVDSRHRALAVIAHPRGAVLAHGGDVDRRHYARSRRNALQAPPLVLSDAAHPPTHTTSAP